MASGECGKLIHFLSAYIDGDIDPAICRHIESHRADCRPCRTFIRNFKRTVKVLQRQPRRKLPSLLQRRLRAQLTECRAARTNKA